jgi:N-methylhydantoinase B
VSDAPQLIDAALVEIWQQRLGAVVDAMMVGRSLEHAVLDAQGLVVAESPQLGVGSLGQVVRAVLAEVDLQPGVVAITNDPFAGGSSLLDVVLVEAIYAGRDLIAHLACRAHHTDVGGLQPGSMLVGLVARPGQVPSEPAPPPAVGPRYDAPPPAGVMRRALTISDEGLHIAPRVLDDRVAAQLAKRSRVPAALRRALEAQRAALVDGREALEDLVAAYGPLALNDAFTALHRHGERAMRKHLSLIPDGFYPFADSLDDDGAEARDLSLRAVVTIQGDQATVDLSECDDETEGSLNAVRAVTESAVRYAFRLLVEAGPLSEGAFLPIEIETRAG